MKGSFHCCRGSKKHSLISLVFNVAFDFCLHLNKVHPLGVDAWEAEPPLGLSFYSDAAEDDSPARTPYDSSSGTCVREVRSDIQYVAGMVSQNQGSDAQKRPHSPLSLCSS